MRIALSRRVVAVTLAAASAALLLVVPTSGAGRLVPRASERGAPPHVVYSTLLGGAAGNFDGANDVAVDSAGNAIVVGVTESDDFPTKNALQDSLEGSRDAFVAKFAPDGSLIFSTFLGGDENDSASAVAVDANGAIYVAGSTNSNDFPLKNAVQSTPGGSSDAFVTMLSADGSEILFSTRIGGNGIDNALELAIDVTGGIYVVGEVSPVSGGSATFPVVDATQAVYGGGSADAFVTFFSPGGTDVAFSTLLDAGVAGGIGAGRDRVSSVRVNSGNGDVFIGGFIEIDEDDPEIPFIGRYRRDPARTSEPSGGPERSRMQFTGSFATTLAALSRPQRIAFKTSISWIMGLIEGGGKRLGEGGPTRGFAAIVEGFCHPDAPGQNCDEPAAFASFSADLEAESAKNLPLLREFFFDAGTTGDQDAVYIAGDIASDRLTTVDPVQAQFGGGDDVVVAVLEPGTLRTAMVSFFGGDGFDDPSAITTDADGNIFVAGVTTLSTVFPTTPGAFQSTPKGRNDAFLVKISPVGPFPDVPDFGLAFNPTTIQVERGSKVSVPLLINRIGGFSGRVKITPPAQVPGFKSPKKKPTVTGDSTVLKFKIKADAPLGPTSFTFTGTDPDGRSRSATVTLDVQ